MYPRPIHEAPSETGIPNATIAFQLLAGVNRRKAGSQYVRRDIQASF